jgi:hypothetical protein
VDRIKKVQFTGKIKTSFFGKQRCVYFEYAFFYGANWSSSTGHYHTTENFFVEVEGKKIELGVPPARLYLKPTYEKEFDSKKAPPAIKKMLHNVFTLEPIPEKVLIREWCIMPNKEYFFRITSETYYLPPLKGSTEPQACPSKIYEIADINYSEEEKKKYKTPASYWTY